MYGTMGVAEKIGFEFTITWECVMYESMKVVQAVRDIVKERPDTVYEQEEGCCLYTEGKAGDTCGCLIGQAIIRVYPELKPQLQLIDTLRDRTPNADPLLNRHLEFDEVDGVNWLDYAQSEQDNGKTWKKAVEKADKNCRLPN